MATQVKTGLIANDAITDAKIANVALTGVTASSGDSSTSLATTAFVAGEINSLIDSAPGALNTLNELAAAMGDDANFSTTVTNNIATKLPLAGGNLTGNLGIGASSPSFPLHINSSSTDVAKFQTSGSYAYTRFQNSSKTWALSVGSDFGFYDEAASATRMLIDSSGNVGIGTTPSTKLDIKTANTASGSDFATKAISVRMPLVSGYSGAIVSGLGFYDNTIYSADIGYAYNRNSTGGYDLVFSTNDDTNGNPVERMTINADGNVGIGTTNPGYQVHIKKTGSAEIELEGTVSAELNLHDSGGTANERRGRLTQNGAGFKLQALNDADDTVTHEFISMDCATGMVGIAKVAPIAWGSGYKALQIGGRGYIGAHSSSDLYVGQNAYFNSGWKYEASVAASLTQHSGGQITHKVAAAGTAGNAITWIDAIHIKPTGEVGVGTTTPRYNLTVAGNNATAVGIGVDNASGSSTLDIAALGTGYANHQAAAGEVWFYSPDNINIGGATGNTNDIKFIANNTVNMRIKGSNGSVTTPSQPYAQIRGTGGWQSLTNNTWNVMPVNSPTVVVNTGSHYSAANKRFTCPVAGKYMVTVSHYIYHPAASARGTQYVHPGVWRNGSVNWNSSMHPYTIYGHNENISGTTHYDGVHYSYVIYCNTNDYLETRVMAYGGNNKVYDNYTYTSFILLG